MRSETGVSTAAMNRSSDDAAWGKILPHLLDHPGHTLFRPARLDAYYVHDGMASVGFLGRLTKTRIRKLEAEGVLMHVGVDRYTLAAKARGQS